MRPGSSVGRVGADRDVLVEGQRKLGEVLIDNGNPAAPGGQVVLVEGSAIEQDGARIGVVHAGEQLDEGALAGAVGPDQRGDPARRQHDTHVGEHGLGALRITKGHLPQRNFLL